MNIKSNLNVKIAAVLSIMLLGFSTVFAQTKVKVEKPVSEEQRKTIENIVYEYLLKNPSVVRDALQAIQIQEEKEKIEFVTKNLKELKSEIYDDVNSPVAGNKSNDVPIAVFYDYFCGYCRKTLPELEKLLAKDSSIRVIYKELPIIGPQSYLAALATLAANRQGKFAEFHQALLVADGILDKSAIYEIAKRVGLNSEVLEKDMKDPKLSEAIEQNMRLATALNINGTPAYIVGDQIIPGAIDFDSLEKMVANQRAKLRSATNSIIVADVK